MRSVSKVLAVLSLLAKQFFIDPLVGEGGGWRVMLKLLVMMY